MSILVCGFLRTSLSTYVAIILMAFLLPIHEPIHVLEKVQRKKMPFRKPEINSPKSER